MLIGQYEPPQNYIYTSKSTEFGRGPKTAKLESSSEITPGPG